MIKHKINLLIKLYFFIKNFYLAIFQHNFISIIYNLLKQLTHEKNLPRQNFAFAGMSCLHVLECNGSIANHYR